MNPQLDTAGRAVVLRAQMDNHGGALKPGMFARVRLTLADTGDTVVVRSSRWRCRAKSRSCSRWSMAAAMRTKVEVGQRRDGKVEIVEGIGGSDTIVVAGWQRCVMAPRCDRRAVAARCWRRRYGQRLVRRRSQVPRRLAPSAVPATEKELAAFLLKAPFHRG